MKMNNSRDNFEQIKSTVKSHLDKIVAILNFPIYKILVGTVVDVIKQTLFIQKHKKIKNKYVHF